jgi:hypothetical protein
MPDDETFSEFMEAERLRLLAAARRARALEHDTNRGSDFERAVRAWARQFVEPEYTVSCGEVIDSFKTHASLGIDRRQQDAIVHKNTRHARVYSFGDDLRIVPIEYVALTVEIKLSIEFPQFKVADASAAITNQLRLAVDRVTIPIRRHPEHRRELIGNGLDAGPKGGTLVASAYKRVWLGIVAADGPSVETIAGWLQKGISIDFICCLSSGCAFRPPFARTASHPAMKSTSVSPAERSLHHLANVIRLSLNNFEFHDKNQKPDWSRYHIYVPVRYYDGTGYKEPPGVTRDADELAELQRMREPKGAGKKPKGISKKAGTKAAAKK